MRMRCARLSLPNLRKSQNVHNMLGDVSVYRKDRTIYTYDCQAFPSRDKAPAPTCAGHHTLRSGGSVHGDTPEIVERVLPLLQRHRVAAYIAGHDHDLQHIRTDGLDYLCCGAGSQVRPVKAVTGTRYFIPRSGFAHVRLSGGRMTAEFRDYTGATLYASALGERA